MILAHFSDTHLGYRAYNRFTPQGFNQREADVMHTFADCLEAMLESEPTVVVHSGDLFHVVRPSNATIIEAYRELTKFQAARKGAPFILIGGNHDTPRTSESGNILKLFEGIPGMIIRPTGIDHVDYPGEDLEVLCVPSAALLQRQAYDWVPQAGRRHSVLIVHGIATQAMLPDKSDFDIDETRHERWTYVALGDFHKFQAFGANVCYAGSTDFTSTNPWEEVDTPKGWVLYNSDSRSLEFRQVETRRVMDLPVIDAQDLSPTDLGIKLVQGAKWEDEMPIVRQVVRNVLPEVRSKISLEAIRAIQARALDYRLITVQPTAKAFGLSGDGHAKTLEASWAEHVETVKLPGGVERKDLRQLGLDLLEEVKEHETAAVEA